MVLLTGVVVVVFAVNLAICAAVLLPFVDKKGCVYYRVFLGACFIRRTNLSLMASFRLLWSNF